LIRSAYNRFPGIVKRQCAFSNVRTVIFVLVNIGCHVRTFATIRIPVVVVVHGTRHARRLARQRHKGNGVKKITCRASKLGRSGWFIFYFYLT
jgi:hypothetical protein